MKRNIIIFTTTLAILLLVCFIAYFFVLRIPQNAGVSTLVKQIVSEFDGKPADALSEDTVSQDWVPFVTDEFFGSSPLSGFQFRQKEVKSRAARNSAAKASSADKVTETIMEKVQDFPFEKIPLLKPAMLISAGQQPFGEDINTNMMFYTEASFEDTLKYYRNILKQYEDYKEEAYDASTGKSYSLNFAIKGKYSADASILVMEMPETTGYTCALSMNARLRGAAKKEVAAVEKRADGISGNYPEKVLPILKMKELYDANGDSEGCYVQYYSDSTYQEAVAFFRDKLNDKTDFKEYMETEGETRFSCLVPGWRINVTVTDGSNSAYINAECYLN